MENKMGKMEHNKRIYLSRKFAGNTVHIKIELPRNKNEKVCILSKWCFQNIFVGNEYTHMLILFHSNFKLIGSIFAKQRLIALDSIV